VNDGTRDPNEPAQTPPPEEIPLARDLTTCVLDFVRDLSSQSHARRTAPCHGLLPAVPACGSPPARPGPNAYARRGIGTTTV
jgi:hypothetical protein